MTKKNSKRSKRTVRSRGRDDRARTARTRISRKHAKKDIAPPWPEATRPDNWRMTLAMKICSKDPDVEDVDAWYAWVNASF